MSKTFDGGPAFPVAYSIAAEVVQGMSLRDYFAAAALSACLRDAFDRDVDDPFVEAPADAYAAADFMLAERAKEPAE